MKLLLVIYDVAFDEDITETLKHCCVTGFTKWDRVLGKGPRSNPKMDDAVWPGYNCAMAVVVNQDNEKTVIEALKDIFNRVGGAGIKIFEIPASEII